MQGTVSRAGGITAPGAGGTDPAKTALWPGKAEDLERFLSGEVSDLLQHLRTLVLDVTSASETVILPRSALHEAEPQGLRLEASAELQDIARQHFDQLAAAAERASTRAAAMPQSAMAAIGADVVLTQALLDERGDFLGSLTLRAEATRIGQGIEPRTLTALGRMIALLISTTRGKVEVELDLFSANERVRRLERIARTDRLTGLDNAASFEEQARLLLETTEKARALILLDVDHFKSINDVYGHKFGDTYLRTVADALRMAAPDGAVIGRLGGDEFAMLIDLPEAGWKYLESIMARCRSSVLRHTALLGKPELGRMSAGAACFPDHARNFDALFELADGALYASKNSGRGAETVFDPSASNQFNHRDMQRQFAEAMRNRRIAPHFQPIYDLRSGRCSGYEVLARWRDPKLGLIKPETFGALLSDYRHAEKLTRLMAREAIRVLGQARTPASEGMSLAINVTTFDLTNPEFVFDFQTLLAATSGVGWGAIVIEVTESIMLGPRNGQIFRTLEELRLRGARVALDDFGTGYGGLRQLSGWPVDIIKLDRHFVSRMAEDRTDGAIVAAITDLARRAGLEIVAEGIETTAQLAELVRIGCHMGQGYLFSPPVPAEEIAGLPRQIDLGAMVRDD